MLCLGGWGAHYGAVRGHGAESGVCGIVIVAEEYSVYGCCAELSVRHIFLFREDGYHNLLGVVGSHACAGELVFVNEALVVFLGSGGSCENGESHEEQNQFFHNV